MKELTDIKLCLVVPDLQKGGMERVMSELANHFSKLKSTRVYILLFNNQSGIFYQIAQQVTIIRPDFHFNKKRRFASTLNTLMFFRRSIRELRPDAVLSFGETYNSFVLLSTILLRTRVFVSDRSRPDKKWGLFQESLRRILYPFAAGIIAQTNFSRDFLIKETGHKNIRVIPNPVKIIENKRSSRRKIILNVGRLIPSKRIDLLLEIFSNCENDGWLLWLVGDDERGEKDKLITLASRLNILDKVVFWGKQENIDRFYCTSEIFAFTSESEGLPNVLLEAMAAGLACISFDCIAGPKDIITDNKDGYLVQMYNCDEYTDKLNSLLNNSELRKQFSICAMERAADYNIEIIGEKYYNFLLS